MIDEDYTGAEALYNRYRLQDFERGGMVLIDLSYLYEMFDLDVVNEKGQPIRLTLTEKSKYTPEIEEKIKANVTPRNAG